MTKNIIKEIIVILLLTLAIILVLGVILYEYVPANKIVPEKISYTTPEDVKSELETDVDEGEEELYVDYHIDSTQINNYKKIQEYVPGRKNPFETVKEKEENASTTEGEIKDNSATGGTTTPESENTGYLPNKGTK